MFVVDDLLMAPAHGLLWIFQEINQAAQEEMVTDAESITAELSTLYMRLETGKITEEEFGDGREAPARAAGQDTRSAARESDKGAGQGIEGPKLCREQPWRSASRARADGGTPGFLGLRGLQLLIFGGKGGVGKTTCATAAALRLAAQAPELFFLAGFDRPGSLSRRQPGRPGSTGKSEGPGTRPARIPARISRRSTATNCGKSHPEGPFLTTRKSTAFWIFRCPVWMNSWLSWRYPRGWRSAFTTASLSIPPLAVILCGCSRCRSSSGNGWPCWRLFWPSTAT